MELIRQTRDVMTLSLFIDLYMWGFDAGKIYVSWVGPAVCHRRGDLNDAEKKAGKNSAVDFF